MNTFKFVHMIQCQIVGVIPQFPGSLHFSFQEFWNLWIADQPLGLMKNTKKILDIILDFTTKILLKSRLYSFLLVQLSNDILQPFNQLLSLLDSIGDQGLVDHICLVIEPLQVGGQLVGKLKNIEAVKNILEHKYQFTTL